MPSPRAVAFAGQRPAALSRAWGTGGPIRARVALREVFSSLGGGRLVTGVALGADQMAIETAAELRNEGFDWRIELVLPCAPALFIAHALEDYLLAYGPTETPDQRSGFVAHWLKMMALGEVITRLPVTWRAGEVSKLPSWLLPTLMEAFGPCEIAPNGYAIDHVPAARYILDRGEMLIALWDGTPSRGPGGTADMAVEAKCRGMPVIVIDPKE